MYMYHQSSFKWIEVDLHVHCTLDFHSLHNTMGGTCTCSMFNVQVHVDKLQESTFTVCYMYIADIHVRESTWNYIHVYCSVIPSVHMDGHMTVVYSSA